ncbi:MAG TPA: MBL fold metallo-hydrolase [Gemmatimonadales bacterium]|jgi:metallo-beta-lactamase family protein
MSAPRTLTFFGGAATATGSMILLEAAGARVLLDAGLFQGNVAQADQSNRDLPLDPARVDAILLSDAGLASAGRAPQLVRHGYAGPIYATPATRDGSAILLAEAALDLETRGHVLYSLQDVFATQRLAVGQPCRRALHLRRNLVFEFTEAGHTLGSASIELRTGEGGSHRIVYSGCVGRPGTTVFRDAEPNPGEVDTLIIGSPFAHLRHPMFSEARERVAAVINDTVERGGQIIVPAATIGPIHEFVRIVQDLWHRGAIPEIPIWMDTPTPVSLTTVLRMHPETIAAGERAYRDETGAFDRSLLHYIPQGQPDFTDTIEGPAMIVAPNETCDAGRSAHHLRRCLGDPRHTVILTAFQEEGSIGRLLEDGASSVEIDGEVIERRASIETMTAYSGFADGEEMRGWIRSLGGPVKRAFVVQGDDLAVAMMVTILREEGVRDVIVPRRGESFPF